MGNIPGDGLVKRIKVSAKPPLAHIISVKLSEFRTRDGRYNKFTQLLSDPYFLVACSLEIKGQGGKMS